MKITNISAANFKGRTFNNNIGPVTVLVGPNDVGKTTRLDAVRTVLNGGVHPDARKSGKGIGETADWLGGSVAQVALTMDNGTVHEARYLGALGAWKLANPPVGGLVPMKPAAEFFAMTRPEQTRYVFSLIPGGDVAEIAGKILAVKETIDPRTDKTDATVDDWHATARITADDRGTKTFNEWLLAFAESVGKRANEVTAAVKRYAGFAQASTEMTAQSAAIADKLPATEAALEQLRAEYRAEAQRHAAAGNALATALKSKVASSAAQALLDATTDEAVIDDLADARNIKTALDKACGEFKSRSIQARKYADDATLAVRSVQQDIKAVQSRIVELGLERDQLLQAECCPTCKSRAKAWKESAADHFATEITNTKGALARHQAKLTQRLSEAESAQESYQTAQAEDREHEARRTDLTRIEREIARLEQVQASRAHAKNVVGDSADTEALAAAVTATEVKLSEITAKANTLTRDRDAMVADKARIEQALKVDIERANAEDELRALKAILKCVAEHQEASVNKAFTSLLSTANQFTAGILPTPLAFRDGELGRWGEVQDGGRKVRVWISHRVFGQTFQTVAYIGLAAALAQQQAFKLVLFDELGILDADNLGKVLRRMKEMTDAGLLDQFIGTAPGDMLSTDATIIHL
jgi:hypothetical protein